MENKIIIACAGAGKTTYIIKESIKLKDKRILITTFTEENRDAIKRKFIETNKSIPNNVTVQTWFSFLIEHCIRPFQGQLFDKDITGLCYVNGRSGLKYITKTKIPVYFAEEKDFYKYYFTNDMSVYSDKIAKLSIRCNESSNNLVFQRIKSIFDYIFIDEIQDMAGFDFELLKIFMEYGINLIMVGDPRQTTYLTHYDSKYKKFNGGNIVAFFDTYCKKICLTDSSTLNITHRCNNEIIAKANGLFPQFDRSNTDMKEKDIINGLYFINNKQTEYIIKKMNPYKIRYNKTYCESDFQTINIGKSKGSEYSHTLLYLTKDMIEWLITEKPTLKDKTKSILYVALTRSKYSCGIVLENNDFDLFLTQSVINGIEVYKLKSIPQT